MSEIVYEDVFNPKPFMDSVNRIEAQGESSAGRKIVRIPLWLIVTGFIGLGFLLIYFIPEIERWLSKTFVSEEQNDAPKRHSSASAQHPMFYN